MTESTQAGVEEAPATADGELTREEFLDRLVIEGVTIDGSFYMPKGQGRQRRYFEYDPGLVKGFDSVREDGEVVAQQIGNHDEAMIEQVEKDHIMDVVFPKVRDGFGVWGPAVTESPAARDDSGDAPDFDPFDAGDVMDTIRENHEEHGFFTEDEDGDEKVVSLADPDARPMGYITGSHVKGLPSEDLDTVDDYRRAVFTALEDTDPPAGELAAPDDVPLCNDDMMETFRQSGNSQDGD